MTPPRPSNPYERSALRPSRRVRLPPSRARAARVGGRRDRRLRARQRGCRRLQRGLLDARLGVQGRRHRPGRSLRRAFAVLRGPRVERARRARPCRRAIRGRDAPAGGRAGRHRPGATREPSRGVARRHHRGRAAAAGPRPDDVPESTGRTLVALADHPPAGLHAAVGGEFVPGLEEPPAAPASSSASPRRRSSCSSRSARVVAAGLPLITALFGLGDLRRAGRRARRGDRRARLGAARRRR